MSFVCSEQMQHYIIVTARQRHSFHLLVYHLNLTVQCFVSPDLLFDKLVLWGIFKLGWVYGHNVEEISITFCIYIVYMCQWICLRADANIGRWNNIYLSYINIHLKIICKIIYIKIYIFYFLQIEVSKIY